MQTRTYYVDDPKAPDWERCTSFEAIADIVQSSRGFFDDSGPAGHPGMRTARVARSGGAKLTAGDIAAWDDLVTKHLVPCVEEDAAALAGEAERLGQGGSEIYARGIALHREKAAWVMRTHALFMEPYSGAHAAARP